MTEKELQIVGLKVILEDGSEMEPSCWAVTYLSRDKDGKPWTTSSWSRQPHSIEEVTVLGVAIEKLLRQYNDDDAIRGTLHLL
jgi:hypothetical protein